MLVSHDKNFIYTKTNKTASTSIELFFEPYCLPDGEYNASREREMSVTEAGIVGYRGDHYDGQRWFNHMPAKWIREELGEETWNSYFKFCSIRNPFDKAVSAFHFQKGKYSSDWKTKIRKIARKLGDSVLQIEFEIWLRRGLMPDDRDKYVIDGDFCVDFFIKYENLKEGIERVGEKVGIDFGGRDIPHKLGGYRDRKKSI
ncbi:sulfotransferase family protein [Salinibacter ruber]|uniref:sulfotransferase family protein n=1 Tax=Salinibacter ruber TaxID=146919 RepID=UPI00216755BB|nr:sulfotransferase family protein [Salinibacter ruber]